MLKVKKSLFWVTESVASCKAVVLIRFLTRLQKKNTDFIILNTLREERSGFETDVNKISIFGRDASEADFPLQSNKLLLLKL